MGRQAPAPVCDRRAEQARLAWNRWPARDQARRLPVRLKDSRDPQHTARSQLPVGVGNVVLLAELLPVAGVPEELRRKLVERVALADRDGAADCNAAGNGFLRLLFP